MSGAAGVGAGAIMTQVDSFLQSLGALYAIPLGLAAFGSAVGILVALVRAAR